MRRNQLKPDALEGLVRRTKLLGKKISVQIVNATIPVINK